MTIRPRGIHEPAIRVAHRDDQIVVLIVVNVDGRKYLRIAELDALLPRRERLAGNNLRDLLHLIVNLALCFPLRLPDCNDSTHCTDHTDRHPHPDCQGTP